MSGIDEQDKKIEKPVYRCKYCSGAVFTHRITTVFYENFDSFKKELIETEEEETDADDWYCVSCGNYILYSDKKFFDVLYESFK